MTARFTLRTFPRSFSDRLQVAVRPEFDPATTPRYNIAPTQPLVVVRRAEVDTTRRRELWPMLWGLVPHWMSDPPNVHGWFNARGETAFEKPAFHSAAKYRRCLVPADGFYQWRGREGAKTPYFYEQPSSEPFCFAGIWDRWIAPDASEREGVAIVTVTTAGTTLPVILTGPDRDVWLDTPATRLAPLKRLIRAVEDDFLTSRRVGRTVNNVRHDSPDCLLSPD